MKHSRKSILNKFSLFQGGTGGLDSWLGENTPDVVIDTLSMVDEHPISKASLNQLLTLAHEAPVSDALFSYYWLSVPKEHPYPVCKIPSFDKKWIDSHQIVSLDHLYWGLYRFYVDALLYFGNIRTAFQQLRRKTKAELIEFFGEYRFDTEYLLSRGDPIGISNIAKDNRYLISEMACKSFGTENLPDGDIQEVLTKLYREHQESGRGQTTVQDLLNRAYDKGDYKDIQMRLDLSTDDFSAELINDESDLLNRIERVSTAFNGARSVALSNTNTYLSMVGDLDAYIATSMRTRQDFRAMADFCDEVFSNSDVEDLKLRYFDPTLSAAAHHEDKGLIECLMVKCAKILILYAGTRDSYGKDAEAAMALSMGKPVIIYADEDYRSLFFRDVHPLSRLIDFDTGVAIGAIVTTSVKEVVEILRRIFHNEIEYELCQTHPRYLVLKEKLTGSVVRLQTSDTLLRETFWNHYHNDIR